MDNKGLNYQLRFPSIRHKNIVFLLIMTGALLVLLATTTALPLWIAILGVTIYLVTLIYCIVESIRLHSYFVLLTFIGMIGIGVFGILFILGSVR